MTEQTITNRVYTLTMTTRSPLHIGTGHELVADYDFVFDEDGHKAYILDPEAVLLLAEQEVERRHNGLKSRIRKLPNKSAKQRQKEKKQIHDDHQQLTDAEQRLFDGLSFRELIGARLLSISRHLKAGVTVEGRPVVRYVLDGDLSDSDNLFEQIKNVYGCPYVPGSSLKGALRTVLAWHHAPDLIEAQRAKAMSEALDKKAKAKFAASGYEEALFVVPNTGPGRINTQNRDVLRMLQVGDSSAAEGVPLMLAPVRIVGSAAAARGTNDGMDVLNVEAIAPDVTMQARLHIECYPFESQEPKKRGVDFTGKQTWLTEIARACRERSMALIAHEMAFFRERGITEVAQFYDRLRKEAEGLNERSFLLCIGWGTGWHGKTLDDRLRGDEETFADLVKKHRMQPQSRRPYQPGREFPKTRKVVLHRGYPSRPLGWVRVEMEEVER